MFDVYQIRKDFPILSTEMNGKPLVYLDNAASSQKPKSVIATIQKYYEEENANIHRGIYSLSQKATERFERTRFKISNFLNAQCAKAIIFTRGATESINLVAQAWGRTNLYPGDEIVLSHLEHHSNIVPWQMLAAERDLTIRYIPLTADFQWDLSEIDDIINPRTKLVSVSQMSNVTGTIFPIERVIQRAHFVGAKVLVDGAQGACHLPVDLRNLDVDFYVFSGHKMLGPTGVGVLYGKEEILESIPPWMGGGDMIETVDLDYSTYAPLPAKLEAGTPNIAGVLGLSTAIDYLAGLGLSEIHNHELSLVDYALELMEDIPGIRYFLPKNRSERGGVLSFLMDGIHPSDLGSILDEEGVAIRVGHHCCQPFMKLNQIPGTCRASFYLYNTREDVETFVAALKKAHKLFAKFARV
jgi:cysteine desulfurase/selenocysteine lyase